MPPRDSAATRRRILDAAIAEFSRYGFAGARIDRIAEAAEANKRMIYAYFENKDTLFDTVIESILAQLHEDVPFTPDDLPGFGAAAFDYLNANPDILRIDLWRRLERPGTDEAEVADVAQKVAALAEQQAAFGSDGRFGPADVLTLVFAISTAWQTAPEAIRALATKEPARQRDLIETALHILVDAAKHH